MKPIQFKEQNSRYGHNQDEYNDLFAHKTNDENGIVVTKWKFSFWDKVKILLYRNMWVSILTFNEPLQPIKISMNKKEHL